MLTKCFMITTLYIKMGVCVCVWDEHERLNTLFFELGYFLWVQYTFNPAKEYLLMIPEKSVVDDDQKL